jgi:hypothetical protein
VIAWISRYADYLRDLKTYFCDILMRPRAHRKLPLHTYQHLSAEECLRKLALQRAALQTFRRGERNVASNPGPRANVASTRELRALIEKLTIAINANGIKNCVQITGLHRDTINDILRGRVPNPQRKTLEKLKKYLSGPATPAAIPKADSNEIVTAEEPHSEDASRSESGDDSPQILRN